MYCPYCGTSHEDDQSLTTEHVIPYALGGSNGLTIAACPKCNNDLGSSVDAPFIDSELVRSIRFFLGLESTKGNFPTLDLSGKGLIGGEEVPILYVITRDGNEFKKEMKIASPKVAMTENPNGTGYLQVSGDPVKVKEIITGKLLKQTRLGKTITKDDGSILRIEDLDDLCASLISVTENPCILRKIVFDYRIPIRFFCKLALAMGHLHLGEQFSRSDYASVLRRHLTITTLDEVNLFGAFFFPDIKPIMRALALIAKPDHHVIAIIDGSPPLMVASLFGEFGSLVPLGKLHDFKAPTTSGTGTVWRIELPSRRLSKLSLTELFIEKAEEWKRVAQEGLLSK